MTDIHPDRRATEEERHLRYLCRTRSVLVLILFGGSSIDLNDWPWADIIICEDDPYYFLQIGEYVPKASRDDTVASDTEDNAQYLAHLSPSYLRSAPVSVLSRLHTLTLSSQYSIDVQGRVIRMDTFSKTVAPGVRLGWFTCNPMFAERFERIGEVSSQSPCGVGQVSRTQTFVMK